jgi:DNA-binding transcriptional ArsR family regulator
MSLNAVSKHLFVLEEAGLIRRERDGAVQSCVLDAAPMASADEWLRSYRAFWGQKFDRLEKFIAKRKGK